MNLPNFKNAFNRVENERLNKHNTFLSNNDDEDNIYYDVVIANNTQNVLPAEYNVSTKKVLIENPRDYYLTITKFSLPSLDIPIFEFPTTPPAEGKIDERFFITIEYNGSDISYMIPYIPTSNVGEFYQSPVYCYQDFIYMINRALRQVLILAWASFGPLPVPDPNNPLNPVPELIFISENEPLSFYMPEAYLNAGVVNPVKIYLNYALYSFFPNFQAIFNGYNTNKSFFIIVAYDGNNYFDYSDAGTGSIYTGNYYKMRQDSATFYLWYDIKDIVITSNLPINTETIGTANQNGDYNTLPILTEVTTTFFGQPYQQKTYIDYIPEPQYRLIDILDHTQLSNINFKFYYRTKKLVLRPFYITPLTTISMKILFVKKDLFKN
jgi:hypothetical protein